VPWKPDEDLAYTYQANYKHYGAIGEDPVALPDDEDDTP
jgi:hypothetical protein